MKYDQDKIKRYDEIYELANRWANGYISSGHNFGYPDSHQTMIKIVEILDIPYDDEDEE